MIGAIIGDIVGSVYEFQNSRGCKNFPLFSEGSTFTDNTVCTVAIAEAILDGSDIAASLRKWCLKYRKISYSHAFRDWLSSDNPQPYNSWGNGSAMWISPAAFLSPSLEYTRNLVIKASEVTHNHPEVLKSALATADTIWLLAQGPYEKEGVRQFITSNYGYDLNRRVNEIHPSCEVNESCQGTVPEAIICALEGTDFEDAIRNAISIGGDSGTVAAIAGSIAEFSAEFGIPADISLEAIKRLPDDLRAVVIRMYDESGRHTGGYRTRLPALNSRLPTGFFNLRK